MISNFLMNFFPPCHLYSLIRISKHLMFEQTTLASPSSSQPNRTNNNPRISNPTQDPKSHPSALLLLHLPARPFPIPSLPPPLLPREKSTYRLHAALLMVSTAACLASLNRKERGSRLMAGDGISFWGEIVMVLKNVWGMVGSAVRRMNTT